MPGLLFTGARLATPLGVLDGWLRTEGTTITDFGSGAAPPAEEDTRVVPCAGGALLPGFIDVHVHGAMGHEVMDADAAGLRAMGRFYASHGVTSFLATTWTAPDAQIGAALDCVAEVMAVGRQAGEARLLGVHLEGPYIEPSRAGAQDHAQVRTAERQEALAYLDRDVIRIITLAPEIAANGWLIDECVARGVTVSAGHTSADYEAALRAVARGVSHVTHTYNAMTPLHHRDPGLVGAALTVIGLRCELIADTVHVHPTPMRILSTARGDEGVVLITDAVRPTGLPDGAYELGGRIVALRDGAVRLPGGGLSGSVLTMDRALRNLARVTDRDPAELWRSASANAAHAAGVGERKGTLAPGLDADLVLLDGDVEVLLTVVEGAIAYAGPS